MELIFDPSKLQIVDIDDVRPNTWNPKELDTPEFEKVVESIRVNGLRDLIVVRDNEGFEIVDGEQRWRAAKRLNIPKVMVYNEGRMSDQRAQELTMWYQVQVPFADMKLAELIKNAIHYPEYHIPYSEEEIQRYLELVNFDENEWNKQRPDFTDQDKPETLVIEVTLGQKQVIQEAIGKVVAETDSSEGRALELICGDYLAGVHNEEAES